MNTNDTEIKKILETYNRITVLGLSPDRTKPSHRIPMFMQTQGYTIAGVYPKAADINIDMYLALQDVPPIHREFVNVFRSSEKIPMVVDEILKIGGVKVLWLQLGIANSEAEKRAEQAGIAVISNRCLLVEYNRHFKGEREVR